MWYRIRAIRCSEMVFAGRLPPFPLPPELEAFLETEGEVLKGRWVRVVVLLDWDRRVFGREVRLGRVDGVRVRERRREERVLRCVGGILEVGCWCVDGGLWWVELNWVDWVGDDIFEVHEVDGLICGFGGSWSPDYLGVLCFPPHSYLVFESVHIS